MMQTPRMYDDRPLTDKERALIRAVEMQVWDADLRTMLRDAVQARGFQVSSYDSPGDLARVLEQAGKGRP